MNQRPFFACFTASTAHHMQRPMSARCHWPLLRARQARDKLAWLTTPLLHLPLGGDGASLICPRVRARRLTGVRRLLPPRQVFGHPTLQETLNPIAFCRVHSIDRAAAAKAWSRSNSWATSFGRHGM
ncbi:hypothetical protein K491DRAFT_90225 [Lophiostoma macrostomum CBS 122681]|uniref:Uncharacterized protein n=1 Tax=Lophiostoma macrostomum CBS 122681 TaxID=1314788 RepID=A0A6A6SV71_9PLEO|nr:hypothetical protein K491DRAFT_90225 [Lophiostoma macrostomum CBS 122681]